MKSRRASLRFKLIAMSFLLIVFVSCILSGITYLIVEKSFEKEARRTAEGIVNGILGLNSLKEQEINRCARQIASRPDIIEAVASANAANVRSLAVELTNQEKLDVLTIADANGIVLARGHTDTAGDSVTNQANVRQALQGKIGLGYEAGTAVKMALRCGYPVTKDGKVVGCVTAGFNLSTKDDFVDTIKKSFDCDISVFSGNERVSTTLIVDGKRVKGTKMEDPVVNEKVLQAGEIYLWLKETNGSKFQYALWPLKSPEAKIIGMMGIRQQLNGMQETLRSILVNILLVSLGGIVVSAIVSTLVAQGIAGGIERHSTTILNSSNDVLNAATQVSEASQTLADGVSSEAASLEETSASIEELVSMTKRNTENADKAAVLAKEARKVADDGGNDTQAMSRAMQEIKRSSDDIAKIIKTIDEIAFQTNILALNAAVEAARAGEAGAGFAVVADEVRSLAHRSAEAAKQTATQIDSAISQTGRGVELSEKVITCLQSLADRVRGVDALIAEVASASKEQNQGLTQLNSAVSSIDRVTQASAASSEETAAAAKELSNNANILKQTVEELGTIVKGSNRT